MENCKEKIEHLQKDLRVLKNQCDRKFSFGGGWDDNLLRFAHKKEIEYAKSGLPFIYNKCI